MKKRLKTILSMIMVLVTCFGMMTFSVSVSASELTTAGTPFSAVTDNTNSVGKSGVTGGETGPWAVTMKDAASNSRLYYGADNAPHQLDLRGFSMKFTINNLSDGGQFRIAFLQNQNEFPEGNYGTGFALFCNDVEKGLNIFGKSLPGEAEFQDYWLVYNNATETAPREDYRNQEIVMTITEDGPEKLLLDMRFTTEKANMIAYRTNVPKPYNFDYSRATLLFNVASNSGQDMKFTINGIKGIRDAAAEEPEIVLPPDDPEKYTVSGAVPFMTYGDFQNNVGVKLDAEGNYAFTQKAVTAMNRVWYGESAAKSYAVDLTDFQMKFAINDIADGASLAVAFMSSTNDYPLETYGTGYSVTFKDNMGASSGHEANSGYYVNVDKFNAGASSVAKDENLVYDNKASRPSSLGKNIILKTAIADGKLTIHGDFESAEGTAPVGFGLEIQLSTLPANFDATNAILLLTVVGGEEDVVYTVKSIEENKTEAYLKSDARARAIANVDAAKADFETFETLNDYYTYDFDLDLSGFRAYEAYTAKSWIPQQYTALLAKLIAKEQESFESISNYTGVTRNNEDGSYAEALANGNEIIALKNTFSKGGSSVFLQKTVDITDFEIEYSYRFISEDTRVSFQFAASQDAYNFNEIEIPGLCIVTMMRAGKMSLMITNTDKVQNIEGVNVDEWHVLSDANGWLSIPIAEGDSISFKLKANTSGDIVLTVANGENSMGCTFPKAFFTQTELDVNNLFFKLYAGDQGFTSGTNEYTVLECSKIRDASGDRALANADSFIATAGAVDTLDKAIELLEGDVTKNIVYIQNKDKHTAIMQKIDYLIGFVNDELTSLATGLKNAADAIKDVSSSSLTQAKLNAALVAQGSFYDVIAYFEYLSQEQIDAISALVTPADYLITKAQVFKKINDFADTANAIKSEEDASNAKELREKVTTADLARLSADDKALANKALSDADKVVTEKEANLSEKSGCSSTVGTATMGIMGTLLLGVCIIARRKAKQ